MTDGEREAAGLLSNSRINNGTGTTTRSQEMVYHAAEELLLNHQEQNELSDDQPRRRSVNSTDIEPLRLDGITIYYKGLPVHTIDRVILDFLKMAFMRVDLFVPSAERATTAQTYRVGLFSKLTCALLLLPTICVDLQLIFVCRFVPGATRLNTRKNFDRFHSTSTSMAGSKNHLRIRFRRLRPPLTVDRPLLLRFNLMALKWTRILGTAKSWSLGRKLENTK